MQRVTLAAIGVLAATLFTSSFGCELIASVDRTKLESGSGGSAGTGGGGTAGQPTTGGGGTGGMPCTTAADCGAPPGECTDNTCDNGACGTAPKAMGAPAATQTAGDCKVNQCDGAGNVVAANDDTDVPADMNECTDDVCTAGTPSNPAATAGTTCMSGVCDGAGACVECLQPSDCPGMDTECQSRTCDAGKCGVADQPQGTAVASQTAGDCKKNQCDGMGSVEAVPDDADPFDDGNDCTKDTCNNGMPVTANEPVNTPCGAGGLLYCNSTGTCVGCNSAAQCGTPANACLDATCVNDACGTAPKADGAACDDGSACSQTDTCQAGACTGGNPVVCSAQDQCHDAGTCDSATGACSNPAKADGVVCNDSNGCTQTDTCQAGTCTGGNQVTCSAMDQCHDVGTCNPGTGVCSNPAKADGSTCNDGSACTQTDTCQSGTCTGGSPVVCMAQDQCHDAGMCDPMNGTCSNPTKADGASCSDGDGCTQSDTCQSGTCTSGAPVTCMALDACHVAGTCSPATGMCSNPNAPNGTACMSGGMPGACSAGVCAAASCSNGMTDGAETGVDCGGGTCPSCANGLTCNVNADCQSNICNVGVCVQCVTASQCPGMDTDCQVRTCNANVCGVSNTAAGTPTSMQAPGDCQQNQCNGNGGVVSVADNTDIPADDGNDCTNDLCVAGAPAHPNSAIDTPCAQNNGLVCDGAGACVGCNTAAQCGTTTQCQTFSCTAHTCGTSNVAVDTACSENGGVVCNGTGACTQPVFVLRVGDGAAALGSAATAAFIEERDLAGALMVKPNNPLALPTSVNGANARLTLAGSSTSEGALSRSANGLYVTLAGYDAAVGTAAIAGTTSAAVNRIIGRVDKSLNIDTTTRMDAAFSAGNVRAATSSDGTAFWAAGSNSGVHYTTLGALGSTQILGAPTNVRVVRIYGGQLYGSSGSTNFTDVFPIGSGLPTMSGATATPLPGMPTTGASPYAFVMFDLNAGVAGYDTLYVADDGSFANGGGVQKWTFDGTTWTKIKTFTSGITTGVRGVTGFISGGTNVTLVATTAGAMYLLVDDGSASPAFTSVATAGPNTAFRGVALAPN